MTDSYDVITDQIVAALEAGTVPWRKPWVGGPSRAPRSVRGHVYRGVNAILTGMAGYGSPYWLTFKQAQELGGSVRKGEHGTAITFWKTFKVDDQKTGKPKTVPMLRWYKVFNTEQTEGCTFPAKVAADLDGTVTQLPAIAPIEAAEAIVERYLDAGGPTVSYMGNRAYYVPSSDEIVLPPRHLFVSPEAVYDTLLHELAHSTGHSSRLNRYEPAAFGSHAYGREELVAEITTAFLAAEAGILPATIQNHAAYCASWIKTIKEDKRAVVVAAGAAQKAADLILGRQPAVKAEEIAA